MEPEGSLPHSQVLTTCPYPEPDRSIPCPKSHLLKIYLNIILPSTLASSKRFPSLRFPTKTLYTPLLSPIRATFCAHFVCLDLITRKILGVFYRSLSSSLCSFLYSSVTSSLLGQNIPLSNLFSIPSAYVPPSM